MADVRLIDANALLKDFAERQQLDRSDGDYADCFMNDAQELSTEWWCVEDAVTSAPTIDAVPVVHAGLRETGMDEAWCSWGDCTNCGHSNIMGSKFCNECGARMDVG